MKIQIIFLFTIIIIICFINSLKSCNESFSNAINNTEDLFKIQSGAIPNNFSIISDFKNNGYLLSDINNKSILYKRKLRDFKDITYLGNPL